MFTDRDANMGIFFVGPLKKDFIAAGDRVDLKIGNERVLLNNVVVISPGKFQGTIYGFEPSFAQEFNGLKVNEVVEFNELHVIGCHSSF